MSNKGNILKILQDETAVKHAFYNALALLITSIFCFIVYGVYHVLEIFMRPLLWAILFGTILHPIKSNLTVKLFKSIHDIQYDVKLFERFQNDAEKKTIKNLKSDNQMKIYYTLYKFGLLVIILRKYPVLYYPYELLYAIEEKLPSSIFESRVLKLLHQIDKMVLFYKNSVEFRVNTFFRKNHFYIKAVNEPCSNIFIIYPRIVKIEGGYI
ncbi:hypothetical protein A3Q56_07174 [Intoshia linei]|uniref:Uncharacterized protein n=1 Tax=Intoshia linei TaxID=1819745 RepID=A0A177ASX0_9BILA|nr:hypothetical protein A3Q56_07174 [Intoshia linei]